jgi:hypothetical protein
MASDTVVPFWLDETVRKRRLYEWADRVLQQLGLIDRVAEASSLDELHKIQFDDAAVVAIALAVQEALHPEGLHPEGVGLIAPHFVGLGKNELKRLIGARFSEAKKLRGQELARGTSTAGGGGKSSSTAYDWTADLKTNKDGAILSLLANLILFLRHHPKWQGVFAFDSFANRVVIRKSPPWGRWLQARS